LYLKIWLLLLTLLAIIFISSPEIDLWAASLFYDPISHFYLKDHNLATFFYNAVQIFSIVWVILLIAILIINRIRKRPFGSMSTKAAIYMIIVLAIGPGLITNIVFKNQWGRARPSEILQFGGESSFSSAFVISDACDRNCSFVSGHASIGFSLVVFSFLVRNHRRKLFALAVTIGSLVGLGRMVQGGHFLSDIIFAFFVVSGVAWLVYYLMFIRTLRE
jgi:lipid A 4'-phosphatase